MRTISPNTELIDGLTLAEIISELSDLNDTLAWMARHPYASYGCGEADAACDRRDYLYDCLRDAGVTLS